MDAKLKQLLDKELLTPEEIEYIEESEEVIECINNGYSSNAYAGSTNWFTVKTTDEEEHDVYCKY